MEKSVGIRDSVHNYITIESKVIIALLDTEAVQRLRGITQLGACTKVFPNATHTRFEHSLGVSHLCVLYANKLQKHEAELMSLIRPDCMASLADLLAAAGLLHDICHGPFSHDWDEAVYAQVYPDTRKGHDLHRVKLIQNDKEIKDALALGSLTPDDIVKAWTYKPFCDIVGGKVGADRLDFVIRDQTATGMRHLGAIDPIRLISNCYLDPNAELCFRANCDLDIKIFLNSRDLAYSEVYWHPVVKRYSDLLRKMMRRLVNCTTHVDVLEEMRDPTALSIKKWDEQHFFDYYKRTFGDNDPLYLQWKNRTLNKT